jgi:hypothetical protein
VQAFWSIDPQYNALFVGMQMWRAGDMVTSLPQCHPHDTPLLEGRRRFAQLAGNGRVRAGGNHSGRLSSVFSE